MFLHPVSNKAKDIRKILEPIAGGFKLSHKKKGFKYYEVACAFDIETSSFYEGKEKRACMYVWQFGIDGHVFIGRTWREFKRLISEVCDILALGDEFRLCCYVHNLAYEFQFMRAWFEWEKVFAIKSRTPVYARTVDGIEFRCSYLLSGYSLKKLGEQLIKYPVQKKTGDLDYNKIRNSKTPLTPVELGYCINDVLVVMAYIQEKIETEGSITKIPYTKTGYVRRYCRNACFYGDGSKTKKRSFQRWKYTTMMHELSIEPDEYNELKRAFQGGYTHAGGFFSGCTVNDVTSYDFTSSYPYALVSEQYPMGKGERVTIKSDKEFMRNLTHYACMFDLDLYGVTDSFIYDHYISRSKCYVCEHAVTDNGRIVSADHIRITVTEQDYFIIRKTYDWERAEIRNFYRYRKAYLPTPLIKAILKLYADKTQLKGVAGKDVEYLNSKEMINACYGMMVTDIIRPINEYGTDWLPQTMPDLVSELNQYNSGYGRFTYYPWGIWCTAYARRNLWTGILEFGEDYVYSDTDSIKAINIKDHMHYIEEYNKNARIKLLHACKHHGIDISETEPKTIKGVKKPLGVWDFDGHYKRFKTLGAKRYMVQDAETDAVNITVSGLNKRVTVPYLCTGWYSDLKTRKEHNTPFERFRTGLNVPAKYTGKNTHTYIDRPHRGRVTDYLGNSAPYYEKTCVHMEGAEYSLSIAQEYIEYILSLEDAEQ